MQKHTLYDCGICGAFHPWEFSGDCRQDNTRYFDEQDYADRHGISVFDVFVLSWEDRTNADCIEFPAIAARLDQLLNL